MEEAAQLSRVHSLITSTDDGAVRVQEMLAPKQVTEEETEVPMDVKERMILTFTCGYRSICGPRREHCGLRVRAGRQRHVHRPHGRRLARMCRPLRASSDVRLNNCVPGSPRPMWPHSPPSATASTATRVAPRGPPTASVTGTMPRAEDVVRAQLPHASSSGDGVADCVEWAKAGERHEPDHMLQACPTSCGICTPNAATNTPTAEGGASRARAAKPSYMSIHRPIACGICVRTPVDSRSRARIGQRRRGATNPGAVLKSCGNSCGSRRALTRTRRRRWEGSNARPTRGRCCASVRKRAACAARSARTSTSHARRGRWRANVRKTRPVCGRSARRRAWCAPTWSLRLPATRRRMRCSVKIPQNALQKCTLTSCGRNRPSMAPCQVWARSRTNTVPSSSSSSTCPSCFRRLSPSQTSCCCCPTSSPSALVSAKTWRLRIRLGSCWYHVPRCSERCCALRAKNPSMGAHTHTLRLGGSEYRLSDLPSVATQTACASRAHRPRPRRKRRPPANERLKID